MTTAYGTPDTALSFMAFVLGVDVRATDAEDIRPEPCGWCGEEGAVAKVRVTAVPNPHETTETFRREVCHHCTKQVVDDAKAVHWDRAGCAVLVEVAP